MSAIFAVAELVVEVENARYLSNEHFQSDCRTPLGILDWQTATQ